MLRATAFAVLGIATMMIMLATTVRIASQGDSDQMTVTAMVGDIIATETAAAVDPRSAELLATAQAQATALVAPTIAPPSGASNGAYSLSPFALVLEVQPSASGLDENRGVQAAAFTPDGQYILTADGIHNADNEMPPSHALELWDATSGERISFFEFRSDSSRPRAYGLAISPDGQRIAISAGLQPSRIYIVELQSLLDAAPFGFNLNDAPDSLQILEPSGAPARSMAWSPNGIFLATGGDDGSLRIWDANTGVELAVLAGHADAVRDLTFNADGSLLASASNDETATIWDMTTAQPLHVLDRHPDKVQGVAFSPDGRLLVTVTGNDRTAYNEPDDDVLTVWDVTTGELVNRIQINDVASFDFTGVDYAPDGRTIAAVSRYWLDEIYHVRVFDAATLEQLVVQPGHGGIINTIDIDATGDRIATASSDGTVRVWTVIR